LLVAIDGPAGAGKSTVARAVARELGFTYLDSGAMYRCVALLSLAEPNAAPAQLARGARIEFVAADGSDDSSARAPRVLLDGRDVTQEIRTAAVSRAASAVARDAGVREVLVAMQRALIATGDWVAEGRDIGTVVAPDAELKVWLTADEAERARRRGEPVDAVRERDARDAGREHSPMVAAPDAVTVDTTGLDVDAVVARIVDLVAARAG
jgi:cytidylate kinase